MSQMHSFTKIEKQILPNYRNMLSHAESLDEVRDAFEQAVGRIFTDAFGEEAAPRQGTFSLAPRESLKFSFREDFLRRDEVAAAWEGSDLPHVLGRLAATGVNRLVNLEKHADRSAGKNR